MNILDVAKLYKGQYVAQFKDKYGKTKKVKLSYAKIKLPAISDKGLILLLLIGLARHL